MINEEIKAKEVRIVREEGLAEVVKTVDALKEAQALELDLIVISESGDIPVVKIGDYNKFLYEKQKKEKENRKKAKANIQNLKEIQISDVIAENDMKTKAKNIDRILKDGDKVKVSIKYKGRNIRNISNGPAMINKLVDLITTNYKIDRNITTEGNTVYMVVSPAK